ncbi:hypothetical protein [Actinophytocola xinjiangensis]|uniref:hypothetical protein n=1 Tax=Actinophytocola xinjiangensis TaxID=485602 RepID=UPI000A4A9A8B|nr:hypothetical protein [Actinophytocola xinjiangensis]
MDRKRLNAVMLVASLVFGLTIGVLAVTGSDAVGLVSMIGGGLLGICWATSGLFTSRDRAQ